MADAHDEEGVEVIGIVPSVLMVLAGLLVAIFPAIMQLILLMGD